MTRLQSADIAEIPSRLVAYDEELLQKTGHGLRQLACHAVELGEDAAQPVISGTRVRVVPIRAGQGVIEGFCDATAAILGHLGFDASTTGHADISGFAEAYEARADAIFSADDDDFIALNTRTRQLIHNSDATGSGFAAGLDLMTGGVAGREVLVLGCGRVGRAATAALLRYGASVSICDIDSRRCREFENATSGLERARLTIRSNCEEALSEHSLIVDATDATEVIRAESVSPNTFVAAPGIPLGVSRSALDELSGRLLHDPLQIGVATMGMGIVEQLIENTMPKG